MAPRIALALILISLPLFAQNEIHEYVQVELVDLYLTATDNKGHFVNDLKAGELTIKENGVVQKIERFTPFAGERNEIPLLLAIVIDNSGSMDENVGDMRRLDLSRDAALSLTGQLGPLDRVMLVRFSDAPVITPLTQDRPQVDQLLKGIKTIWGPTALFDSLASVIEELNKDFGRKVLFLCSDGQDNLSHTKFKEIIDLATSTTDLTVVILGVGATNSIIGGPRRSQDIPDVPYLRSKEYLQKLADDTAGFAYFPENQKDAAKVLDLMSSFIRSQYQLAYRSTNPDTDKSFRRIEISTTRRGVTLHYRSGYQLK